MKKSVHATFVPPREWEGCTAFVIGGGSSITDLGHDKILPKLEGRYPIIAVNNAYLLCPTAEVLFGADQRWWSDSAYSLHRHLGWYKIARRPPPGRLPFKLHLIHAEHKGGLSLDPRTVYGRNGGHMAMNLAVSFGASRVILVGFDLNARAKRQNFHDLHRKPANTEAFGTWINDFALAKPVLEKAGIEVLNANGGSALKVFPFCELEDFV